MIVRTIIANYAGRLLTLGLSIGLVPIYTKLLGLESYGLIGVYVSFQGFLTLLELGVGAAAARRLIELEVVDATGSRRYSLARRVESWFIRACLAATVAAVFISSILPSSYFQSIHPLLSSKLFLLILLTVIWRFPVTAYTNIFIGYHRQVSLNITSVFAEVLRNLIGISSLLLRGSAVTFFSGQVVAALLIFAIYRFGAFKFSSPTRADLPQESLRPLFSVAAPMFAVSVTWFIIGYADKIILAGIMSPKGYGAYVIAYQLATGVFAIYYPIFQSYYPQLVRAVAQDNEEETAKLVGQSAAVMGALLSALGSVTVISLPSLTTAWLHNEEIGASVATLAQPLVLAYLANGIWQMPYALLIAKADLRVAVAVNVLWACGMPFVLRYGFSLNGAVGAAWAWGTIFFVYGLLISPWVVRRYAPRAFWTWLMPGLLTPMVVIAVLKIIWPSPKELWSSLATSFIVGSLAFALSLMCSNAGRHIAVQTARRLSSVALRLSKGHWSPSQNEGS